MTHTADINTLADAIAAEMNAPVATTWDQTFTAEVAFRKRENLEEIGANAWLVDVMEATEETEMAHGAYNQVMAAIDIIVIKKANPDDPTTVKPVLNLIDQFKEYWLRRHPATMAAYSCIKTTKTLLWVPELLEANRVCLSVLRLTFLANPRVA